MTPAHSDRLAQSSDTTASDLIAELQAVRDSVEELYLLLDHIWRNREELRDILAGLAEEKADESQEEEIIVCCHCEASPPSLAAAIRQGWTDFQFDRQPNWSYLAICPDCQQQELEEQGRRRIDKEDRKHKKQQKGLF